MTSHSCDFGNEKFSVQVTPEDKKDMLAKYAQARVVEKVLHSYLMEAYPDTEAYPKLTDENYCVYNQAVKDLRYAWYRIENVILHEENLPDEITKILGKIYRGVDYLTQLLTGGQGLCRM